MHLVHCVTRLRLTVAVKGSHGARVLCSPSPSAFRAAEEIETFSLALLLVYLNPPRKQWNQGACTQAVIEGRWKYCSGHPPHVLLLLLVPA